jgi:hypothetical protein
LQDHLALVIISSLMTHDKRKIMVESPRKEHWVSGDECSGVQLLRPGHS